MRHYCFRPPLSTHYKSLCPEPLKTLHIPFIFILLTLQQNTKSHMTSINDTYTVLNNSSLYFDDNLTDNIDSIQSFVTVNTYTEKVGFGDEKSFKFNFTEDIRGNIFNRKEIDKSSNKHSDKSYLKLSSSEKEKNHKKKIEVDEATQSKLFWDFSATLLRYNKIHTETTPSYEQNTTVDNLNITFDDDFFNITNNQTDYDISDNMTLGFLSKIPTFQIPLSKKRENPTVTPFQDSAPKVITILGLFELSEAGAPRPDGASELAAAQLAVHHVNQGGVLPGYTMQLLTNDTECDPGVAVDRFFHALYSQHRSRIMMLLGTACSEVTESIAKIVPYWNIVQVSFGSTSPALSDRSEFPLFCRTVAPDSSHNLARIVFIKQHGWDTVTAFSQNEGTHSLAVSELVTQLEAANVTCDAFVTFAETDFKDQLRQLKNLDTRIIIGSFSHDMIPKIFCEVHQLGMFGGQYAWLVSGEPPAPLLPPPPLPCLREHLAEALESTIFVDSYRLLLHDETAYSGLTNEMLIDAIQTSDKHVSPFASQAYDAVWSIALALKNADRLWKLNSTENIDIGDFDYNRRDMAEEFLLQLGNLNFKGVSGPITFNGADRMGTTVFYQIQGGKPEPVAFYAHGRALHCTQCAPPTWEGGIPVARRLLVFRLNLVWIPARLVVTVLALCGIMLAAVFLHFNLHYSKRRSIKLSSPRLNNMTLVGSVLVYTAVALLGADSGLLPTAVPFAALCIGRVYILSAGFSLAFGSMFAKTYRVHRIFISNRNGVCKTRLLQDTQLIFLVCALLAVDGVVVTLWATLDPMTRDLKNLTVEYSPEFKNVVYQPQVEICKSNNTTGWLCALYTYKALFLIVGVYMAWETRNVKITALNDSKYIGISVYTVVITSISVVATEALLAEKVTVAYIVTSSLILLTTTSTLCLLFLPKILAIRSNGEIDPVTQSLGLKLQCNTRRFVTDDRQEVKFRVEVQNRVFRQELKERDKEIARLERLLAEPITTTHRRRSDLNTVVEESIKSERRTPSISGGLPLMLLSVLPPVIPRASWPSADALRQRASVTFSSQPKLNRKSQPNIDLFLTNDSPSQGFLKKVKNFFSSRSSSRKASTVSIADPTGQSIAAALKFHASMLAGLMPGSRKHSMVVSCNTLNVPPIEMKLRRTSYAKSGPIIRVTDDEPTCSKYLDVCVEVEKSSRNKYVAEPETKVNFVLPTTPQRRRSHHSSQKIKSSPRFPHRISPAASSLNNFDMKRNSSDSVFSVSRRVEEIRRSSHQCDGRDDEIKSYNSAEDAPGPSTKDEV